MAEGFSLPGRQQLRHVVRQRRQPGGDFPLALLGLKQLVGDVQGREDRRLVCLHDRPLGEDLLKCLIDVRRHFPGVLGGKIGADRVLLSADHHLDRVLLGAHRDPPVPPPPPLPELVAPPVPPAAVAPAAPSAPPPTARPPRARAASESGRGTCNATRRCADPPARRRRDIRRTPPAARAGVPSRGPGLRPQPRRSPLPATTAPCHARPAAAWAGADTARRPAGPSPAGPRTRIVARPRPGNRPRGSLPAPLLPRPVAPPPTRPQSPLPLARYSPGRRPPPLTP